MTCREFLLARLAAAQPAASVPAAGVALVSAFDAGSASGSTSRK